VGAAVQVDDKLLDFFKRPLMCIIAAADETGHPSAGRGVGFHIFDDRETIDVIFSSWQWPRLETSVRQTGRIAATFVSPSDYVSFQLKGAASMRDTRHMISIVPTASSRQPRASLKPLECPGASLRRGLLLARPRSFGFP